MAATGDRAEQREVLALLLGIGALVLPLGGALMYLDFTDSESGLHRWVLPFLGASNTSDLIGPSLLAGAIGLGIVISRGRHAGGTVPTRVLGTVVVVGALTQAAGFAVSAVDFVRPGGIGIPPGAAWATAKWSLFARLAIQALLCVVAVVYGMRWLQFDDRRNSS